VTERREHYSYTVYADPATAQKFDRKFAGPVGAITGSSEADAIARFAGPLAGRTVLDVGTGTGRIAMFLSAAGAAVTGVDASNEMLAIARAQAVARHLEITFTVGDAHALDFPDRSFDIAVSSRMLMHTPQWQVCIGELCRVARERVVIDYPSARSFAIVQSWWRRGSYAMGGPVRQPYRVFLDREISEAFRTHGFEVQSTFRHFVVPIGFYRLFQSARLLRTIESFLRRLGVTRAFANPVTVLAQRCATS